MPITGPAACVIKHGWPGNPRLVEVLHGCLVAQSSIYILTSKSIMFNDVFPLPC